MIYEHPETHLGQILLTEAFGVALVAGPDRMELLASLAATASEVVFFEEGRVEEVAGHMEDLGTETFLIAEDEMHELDPASLLILGRLAEDKVEEDIDRLLGAVADDGFVLCDLPVMARPLRLRVERLLSRLLVDVVDYKDLAETGALILTGRRKARGREFAAQFEVEPLSLTVFIYSTEATEDLNLLVLDVLHRQSCPPALLIVLDDATEESKFVPDDLWGLAGHSFTQPAIMRTGGVGRAAALQQGMAQFETDYLAFLEVETRLAPLWAERLCAVLDANAELTAAVGGAIERLEDGDLDEHVLQLDEGVGNPLALLLAGTPPTTSAVVFRDGPALDCRDLPSELDAALGLDMLLRAAEEGNVASVPLPLLAYRQTAIPQPSIRLAIERFAARIKLPRLEDALKQFTAEDREGLARHVIGGALHEAASFERATEVYLEALKYEPDLVELRIDLLRSLREIGDPQRLLDAAEAALEVSAEEPGFLLARSTAAAELGRLEGLEASLDCGEVHEELPLSWNAAAIAAIRLNDVPLKAHLMRIRDILAENDSFSDLEDLLIRFDLEA